MEELLYEIKLLSNTMDNCPQVKISINDTEYFCGQILGEEIVTFKSFTSDNFKLNIEYAGNNPKTYILDDQGLPTNAITVIIDTIKIEGIDITNIAYTKSVYNIDPNEKYIVDYKRERCMDLGPRGVWILPIGSPVYIWMLENL
tara:strand:+ start:282 stop:713 length:432 start_codon:yes stop_codon:yes gene_type:complete